MNIRKIVYIYYYEHKNMLVDEYGRIIYNPFTMITPQDLYLFKRDSGIDTFPLKGYRDVICRIIAVPEEASYLNELSTVFYCDDYEALNRYEEWKSMSVI